MAIRHLAVTAATTAVVLFVAACSSGGDTSVAPPTTGTTVAPIVVHWTDTEDTALRNGWFVRDCGEGGRTHVCVHDDGGLLGDIELLPGYPLDASDDPAEPAVTARAWAQRMTTDLRADRTQGCPAFTFEALPIRSVTVGGFPGARGGFRLRDAGGRVVEHVINHYVVVGGRVSIVNTDAYASAGGCLPPSEDDPSFRPERLAELGDDVLDRIVAGSPAAAG